MVPFDCQACGACCCNTARNRASGTEEYVEVTREDRLFLDLVAERDDVVVMSMNYPWGDDPPLEPTRLERLRRTARRTLDASVLAVDYLAAHEDVDEERIVLVGVSFGSLFATPVAAYDERVDGLGLIYGGGDLGDVIASNPPRGLGWVPPGLLRAGGQAFADDYDPLHHIAAVSPRPVFMANSTRDETFPPDSARVLYARAEEPKELRWFDTGHGDLFDRRVVARITAEVVEELEEWGLVPTSA